MIIIALFNLCFAYREVDKGHPLPPPLPPPVETGRKSYVYPIYYGNSMVAEIRYEIVSIVP